MPTHEYPIPDAPSATSINQQQSATATATACPLPLTPPAEELVSSDALILDGNVSDVTAVRHRSDNGDAVMNNNTGAAMATGQEDSLYLGFNTDSPVATISESYINGYNHTDVLFEENGYHKTSSAVEHVDSKQMETTPAPPSPESMASYSPTRNQSNSTQYRTAQPTDQHRAGLSGREVQSEKKTTAYGPHTCTEQPTEISCNSSSRSISKVDSELDWRFPIKTSDFTHKRLEPRYPSSLFQCDSRYEGTQQSDRQTYNVHVRVLTVDMDQCTCTGYLTIKGLTPEHETLQTYFTGEIIGGPDQKYSFRTKTPDWGASDKTDLGHWARFQAWRSYAAAAKKNLDFVYPPNGQNWWQQDNVFMRWKEHFLVPDHKTHSIAGASFEGFYYICLNQIEGKISGIYFHSKSEKYQQLELKHEGGTGTWHHGITPCVEFR